MKKFFNNFLNNESGAAALEYGILIAVVAGVVLVSMGALGTSLDGTITAATTAVDGL